MRMIHTVHYSLPSNDEGMTTKMACSYDPKDKDDQGRVSEECARDHFYNHDGWDHQWPLIFALHEEENGPEMCRFKVELELVPEFLRQED